MLLVCDLDRTLIPNGKESEDDTLKNFYNKIKDIKNTTLVYASGRNLNLLKKGKAKYKLELPEYFLGSVGTEVYLLKKNFFGLKKLIPDPDWDNYVKNENPNWNRESLVETVSVMTNNNFYLQEESVQNKFKVSYYLNKETSKNEFEYNEFKDRILKEIQEKLDDLNLKAELIYSFDQKKSIGLVDILAKKASKLSALEFLIKKLNYNREDVIYAGDSGNDLLPLTAGINAILVNNARPEIKQKALEIVKEKGSEDRLFISTKNYSAGVIEGVNYFLKKQ